ncbi:hypothetical protein GQ457_16G005900 [Hibiscus cannabinus]
MICYACGCYGHTEDLYKKVEANDEHNVDIHDGSEPSQDDKFGPWMQASSRRNRKLNKGNASIASSRSAHEGAVMGGVEKCAVQQSVAAGGSMDVVDNVPLQEKGSAANTKSTREDVVEMLVESKGTNGGDGEVVSKVRVTSSVEVIPSQVTLNPKDHVVVQVLERGVDSSSSPGVGRRSNPTVEIALSRGTQ